MSLIHELVDTNGDVTDITDRVRLVDDDDEAPNATSMLEDGAGGTWDLIIDDPDGDLVLDSGFTYRCREGLSVSSDPYLFSGSFSTLRVIRGPYRTGVSRQWRCSVMDPNRALNLYIFRPEEDANRPAETAGARLQWLYTTTTFANFDDTRYADTSDTTPMGASDYRKSTPFQVLDDMAQQSGYDYGVRFSGDVEQYAVVYQPGSSTLLTSAIRLSNDLDDCDLVTTFPYSLDTELEIDDSRIASGGVVSGDGIDSWFYNSATAVEWARRDLAMSAPYTKDPAKLKARANRYAATLNRPDHRITGTVILPARLASQFKAYHRVQFKGTHMPGYEDFVWVRVTTSGHEPMGSEDDYAIRFELVPPNIPPPAPPVFAILYGAHGPYGASYSEVWWESDGDNPMVGAPIRPLGGLVEVWEPGSPPLARDYIRGFNILGTGTIDATLSITALGVACSAQTITFAILLNGAVVASQVSNFPDTGGFCGAWSDGKAVSVSGLAVVPGDKLTAAVIAVPGFGFVVPGGTGGAGETFEITGGTLV